MLLTAEANAYAKSIAGELVAVGSSNDNIAGYGSVSNLAGDILVTEPDNETVLRCVVLVLVL